MVKRLSFVLILCIAVGFPLEASGHEYDREEWTDAFEVLDYVASPVSYTVEHVVLKPLHALLSIGPLKKVFGHEKSKGADCGEMERGRNNNKQAVACHRNPCETGGGGVSEADVP